MIALRTGRAVLDIDPASGGRAARLRVGGIDLLVDRQADPKAWGSFLMVPFAGRVRDGRFRFGGCDYVLPPSLGRHAIHGYGHISSWEAVRLGDHAVELSLTLGPPWPFGGQVVQRVSLTDVSARFEVELRSDGCALPATVGWHPWWRRRLDVGGAGELALRLDHDRMRAYERDADAVPTGLLRAIPPHPWDDCFVGLRRVGLAWPGALTLEVRSDCRHWVIYEPDHAVCVEPMSGPPDAFTIEPFSTLVEPGRPLRRWMEWHWQ